MLFNKKAHGEGSF